MPFPWEKMISQKPQVLETAKAWYEKWIRGEQRTSANDAPEQPKPLTEGEEDNKVEAYAELIAIDDVVEAKETTPDVASRLEALEFAGMAQAETVKNLSDQSQQFSCQLSDLQGELEAVDQRLQQAKAEGETQQASLGVIEKRVQTLTADFAQLKSRVSMGIGIAVAAAIAAVVAIALPLYAIGL